ncbi:MsnO8 family LLM class oxidoreductase [Streptomyces arboris]|uniref:MsnO8 family LLM class oxidoreductase n=1 Tax=Streptomyces arboris TaxID=2600619 RepID=UPI003BF5E481
MRLSVLDQSPVGEGSSHADALLSSVDLAQAAEEWGFARYWTAEHHGSPGFAGSAPEILAAVLLARTSRMPVGTGGVLLPRYPPAKVAEVFAVLASLYPGRVGMGLGRAGGPAADYPERVSQLRRLLGMDGRAGDGTAEAEADRLVGAPAVPPRMWLLGAGAGSARMAGELGTDFAFAHFLAPDQAEGALAAYRGLLAGRNAAAGSPGVLAVRAVTAESEAEAEALAHSVCCCGGRGRIWGRTCPCPRPGRRGTTGGRRWRRNARTPGSAAWCGGPRSRCTHGWPGWPRRTPWRRSW